MCAGSKRRAISRSAAPRSGSPVSSDGRCSAAMITSMLQQFLRPGTELLDVDDGAHPGVPGGARGNGCGQRFVIVHEEHACA